MSRFRAPRMALCALVPAASLVLSSCTPPAIAPNPDVSSALSHVEASADAFRSAGQTPVADRLSVQADTLGAELDRLCGTNASGQAPSGCSAQEVLAQGAGSSGTGSSGTGSQGDLSQVLDDAQQATINALATAKSPSVDRGLLAGVFAGLAVTAAQSGVGTFPYPLPEAPTPATTPRSETVEAITHLVEVEHQVIYGLGVAQAYATGNGYTALSSMLDKHRRRRDELTTWLTTTGGLDSGQVPLAAAGYLFTTQPTDPTSALTFAVEAEFMVISQAYRAAQTMHEPAASALLLADVMQEAAVDAAYCVRLAGANPLTDGRFAIPGLSA